MRWILGCLTLCGLALMGARAVRRPPMDSPGVSLQPAAVPVEAAVLSVENAVELAGRWYIADQRGHRVHVLDSTGVLQRSFGRRGQGPGEFIAPSRIAGNRAHTFVAEMGRPAISVFDSVGNFLRFLRVRGPCADGNVSAMAASGSALYVLRRCVELPRRIRLQVERSIDGGALKVWDVIADTTAIDASGGLPIHVPVLAVSETRLVMGDGTIACLRAVRLPDGAREESRCFSELPRQPVPAEERQRLTSRWAGRIEVPDSLPRVMAIGLRDSAIALQIPESAETTTWVEVRWRARPLDVVRALGRSAVEKSFLGPHSQLIAIDDAEGVRLQVVRLDR
jgi:hypothetical protein